MARLLLKAGVDTSAVETNVAYADQAQGLVTHPLRSDTTGGWTHYAQMVLPATVFDLTKPIAYMKWKTNLDAVQLAKGKTAFVPPA